MSKIITLALDLGSSTGWSILERDGRIVHSGTYRMASKAEEEEQKKTCAERFLDIRFVRLLQFIEEKCGEHSVERIVFEDVQFASSTMQVQLWTTFRAAIWAYVCRHVNIRPYGVAVGTLKKFATTHGDVQKEDMAAALILRLGPGIHKPVSSMDDNEVDAIWLAIYASEVDSGTQDFLGPYTRKLQEKMEKRAKKKANKLEAGKCPHCKVNRKLTIKNIKCPKCGEITLRQINAQPSTTTAQDS